LVVREGWCIIFPWEFCCVTAIWVSGNGGVDVIFQEILLVSVRDDEVMPIGLRDQNLSRSSSALLVDLTVCNRFTMVLEGLEGVGNGPERRYPSFDATAVGP
jgi:hypothetical protein